MPSPLLQRVDPAALSDDLWAAWSRAQKQRGDATFIEVMANHPALYAWYADRFYGELFNEGVVARPFKELLRLRLSQQHGCRFCNLGNRADALAAGFTETQLDAILHAEDPCWGPAERAVLTLAERMALTDPGGALDTPLYDELSACFNDAQVLELGMVAGILAGMAKFLFAYDLVERESRCPFPHPDNGA